MAKEIVINVTLESQGVVENIQKIETELAKLNKERDALLNSGLSTEALTSSLNNLDGEIAKLNGTYDKLIQSTNSYAEATEKTNNSAEKAAQAQAKVEKTIKTTEGVTKTLAGSVNLATSAFALFGVENEEVQKTLLKVQAAASFSTGIKDLAEGFKALNVAGISLNKTLLANPFVLIASLVVTLIGAFGGFDEIIKIVTSTLTAAFAPFNALIGAFKSSKKDVEDINAVFERYEKTLERLNRRYSDEERRLQNNIDILKAQGKSVEDIRKEEDKLLEARVNNSGTLIAESKAAIGEFIKNQIDVKTATDEQFDFFIKKQIDTEVKSIANTEKADAKRKELNEKAEKLLIGLADARANREDAIAQKTIVGAERLQENREKEIENVRKANEEKVKGAEKEKKIIEDLLSALRKQIQTQEELAKKSGEDELARLKQQLLNREITQEQFDELRVQNDIKTNDLIVSNLQKFQISVEAQEKIGTDNVTTILGERNAKIIQAERKNLDTRLAEQKKNDAKFAAETAAFDKQLADDRLAQVETDYQQKLLELNGKYNLENEFEARQHALELQKIEIEKQRALLLTVDLGSKEYFDIVKKIDDAETKLTQDSAKLKIDIVEDFQTKLLAAVKTTVEGIATIVQDVSPLFESVGQTALATLSNIATQVPDLLAKFQDETLSQNDKIAAGLSFVASSIGQINDIVQDGSERRIEALNNEEAERIASLKRQKEEGLITEEQLAAGITQIEGEYAKKRREQQKKAFQLEKGIRIVQAVAQTAAAALAAYTSGLNVPIIGPAIAPVFAGIAAAFGAAQVALIASQKFPDEGGGATGGATTPAVPSTPALGSITPTQFEPSVFGTGAQQEQVFGATTNPNQSGNVLRAYVVESDIASTSNRLNSIRTTSEL